MVLNDTAIFFSFSKKKRHLLIVHYCVVVFSRSSHQELKIASSLKNACKEVPFLLKWYTWRGMPATLLKTIICRYFLPILFKVLYWLWVLMKFSRGYFSFSSGGFRWKAIYLLGYIIWLKDIYGFFLSMTIKIFLEFRVHYIFYLLNGVFKFVPHSF